MNETIALWLASRAAVERWREEMAEERARRPRRRAALQRWGAWLRTGRLGTALGLAGRGRAPRPAAASGPECCDSACRA